MPEIPVQADHFTRQGTMAKAVALVLIPAMHRDRARVTDGKKHRFSSKDSPANGTSAAVPELISGS
jgi:hypothetical protein